MVSYVPKANWQVSPNSAEMKKYKLPSTGKAVPTCREGWGETLGIW